MQIHEQLAGWRRMPAQQGENIAPGPGQLGAQGLHGWVRTPLQHLSQADVAQDPDHLKSSRKGKCKGLERMNPRGRQCFLNVLWAKDDKMWCFFHLLGFSC